MRFVALIVLAIVAVTVYLARRPRSQMSPDARVIEQLRKAGSDLSKIHTIDFNLDFPSESSARGALAQLELLKYLSEAHQLNDGAWTITVHKTMKVEESAIGSVGSQLAGVAARFGGRYDGWGTSVES